MRKSKLYDYDFVTGLLQYRSRPERYGACQGKGKFGKLGGGSHEVLLLCLWFLSVIWVRDPWLKHCGYHLSIIPIETVVKQEYSVFSPGSFRRNRASY